MRMFLIIALGLALVMCQSTAAQENQDSSGPPSGPTVSDDGQQPAVAAQPPAVSAQPAAALSEYAQTVLADNPLVYWQLNDVGDTAHDASGNGHDASITGGVTLGAPGAFGGATAMTLDGQTGFLRDNASLTIGPDFTIEAWVKASSVTEDAPILTVLAPDGQGFRSLYLDAGHFRGMDDATGNWPTYSLTTPANYDTTAWHHVVFTTQGDTNLTVWVDGVLAASGTVPNVANFSGNPVLGFADNPAFHQFAGSLEHVALYAQVLSPDRIAAHYTAATGSAPGADCSASLQSLINTAPAGSVLRVPKCLYRETIVINKPLTLDGQGQAEVRGSDVWTDWTAAGSRWVSRNSVPDMGGDTPGSVYVDQFRAAHIEQVFVDGGSLTQVPSNPDGTQFALDSGRHVIIGTNPAGHVIEVTTRRQWEITQADNVTVANFTFRDAATGAQGHAIGNDDHNNFTLSNSTLSDAHGSLLAIGGAGSNASVLGNTISRAGDLAIAGFRGDHTLIQGNTITQSGRGGWDSGWQAGGIKNVGSTNLTVDGNSVFANGGSGIWCDIGCHGITVTNNKVYGNTTTGIFFEISTGANIARNAVWGNGREGIYISDSGGAEVSSNVVAWNAIGVSVLQTQRSDRPDSDGTGNYVHNNVIAMSRPDAQAFIWVQSGPGKLLDPSAGNHGANNSYWYPSAEDNHDRFSWQHGFQKLSDFSGTPGDSGGKYLSQADRDASLNSAGVPLSPG